jgi:hypothetical protein
MLEFVIMQLVRLKVSYKLGPEVRKWSKKLIESAAAEEYVVFCVALYRYEDRLVESCYFSEDREAL